MNSSSSDGSRVVSRRDAGRRRALRGAAPSSPSRRTRPCGRRRRRCSRPGSPTDPDGGPSSSACTRSAAKPAEHLEPAGLDDADRRAASPRGRRPPRPRSGCATTAAPSGPGRAPRARRLAEDLLHQRIEPGRRLVEQQQSARLANAAISRTFCRLPWLYARIFLSSTSSKRCTSSSRYAVSTEPWMLAEEPQHLRARERRPQVRLARHVREARWIGRGVAPDVQVEDPRARRTSAGSGRAGARWSSTCRRRSAPGSRTPRPARSRGRARRARSSARTASSAARCGSSPSSSRSPWRRVHRRLGLATYPSSESRQHARG